MVCIIRKIEVNTSTENGNYLTVTGTDARELLDRRVVWQTTGYSGTVESAIRDMITKSCISATNTDRNFYKSNPIPLLKLGTAAGFADELYDQISYKNVGGKIRDICNDKKWGYRIVLDDSVKMLVFELYKGADRSASVIFSPKFENLSESKTVVDCTDMGNVTLIGGTGEGTDRELVYLGEHKSTERFEFFTDAKDIPRSLTFKELRNAYPAGYLRSVGGGGQTAVRIVYVAVSITFPYFNDEQLTNLQADYTSGTIIYDQHGNVTGYQVYDADIADIPGWSDPNTLPPDDRTVNTHDGLYDLYLFERGLEKIAEHGKKQSFDGTIIPNGSFVYKTDYFIGDIVTVADSYGNSKAVRIIEAMEVYEVGGSRVELKFRDISEEEQ